jgi:hypothetical protein
MNIKKQKKQQKYIILIVATTLPYFLLNQLDDVLGHIPHFGCFLYL